MAGGVSPKALLSPKAILRAISIVLAIISFAIVLDRGINDISTKRSVLGDVIVNYGHGARLSVAYTIPAAISCGIWLCLYVIIRCCLSLATKINMLELIVDVVLTIWGIIGGIVWSKYIADLDNACGASKTCFENWQGPAAIAAIVFHWLLVITFVVSTILDLMAVLRPKKA